MKQNSWKRYIFFFTFSSTTRTKTPKNLRFDVSTYITQRSKLRLLWYSQLKEEENKKSLQNITSHNNTCCIFMVVDKIINTTSKDHSPHNKVQDMKEKIGSLMSHVSNPTLISNSKQTSNQYGEEDKQQQKKKKLKKKSGNFKSKKVTNLNSFLWVCPIMD